MTSIVTALLGSTAQKNFKGFLFSYDNIPPLFVKFGWNPETYTDDWQSEFAEIKTPFSRAPRLVWTGNSSRIFTFGLRADQDAPTSCWDGFLKRQQALEAAKATGKTGEQLRAETIAKTSEVKSEEDASIGPEGIEVLISAMEQLKLPKSPLITGALSLAGSFGLLKGGAGASNAAPPRAILGLGWGKFVQGYVRKCTPKIEKLNSAMRPTRVQFEIEFVVEPGTLLQYVEDMARIANNFIGLSNFWS
jgi:hypothetical protein